MYNKNIISKGLTISILLLNTPVDSIADTIQNYNFVSIENSNFSLKENKFGFFNKFNKSKNIIKPSKNIKIGTVLDITLNENEFISGLEGNPQGYETVRVTTLGNKKLSEKDYSALRVSAIPKIDLSNSYSDSIPSGTFTDALYLTEFKFPQGITSIGDTYSFDGAFEGCRNLTGDLIIPNTVTFIGNDTFQGCTGFTGDLVIPDSVLNIGDSAFYGCDGFNGTLTLSNSLLTIGSYAFEGCSSLVGDLIIPNSVISIGVNGFRGCSGFNGELVISESLNKINDNVFSGCSGLIGDLIIPSSVTSIGSSSFFNCSSFNGVLSIPETVTIIGPSAFENCERLIGDLILPKSITSISRNTFKNCRSLNGELVLPNSQGICQGSYHF